MQLTVVVAAFCAACAIAGRATSMPKNVKYVSSPAAKKPAAQQKRTYSYSSPQRYPMHPS